MSNDVLEINDDEMKIRRIAAVSPGSYKYSFVMLDVAPLPPIGIYEHTEDRIAEVARGEGPFPYYWEEFGLVDGKHVITRGELDDGSAKIDGKLQSVANRVSYRGRYVTDHNCVIAGGGSPIMNSDYDERLETHLNAMLHGEDRLEDIAKEIARLPTGRF